MSGGTWTVADTRSPATRPGVYVNLIAQAQRIISEDVGGTIFVMGAADWGPLDEVVDLTFAEAVDDAYGSTEELPKLARSAFAGGALEVMALRIATSAAAKATVALVDATPQNVAALVVTAKYEGERGNNLRLTVKDHPSGGSAKVLELVEAGVLLESYFSAEGTNTDFSSVIGDRSSFIDVASSGAADRELNDIAAAALTGGNSGEMLVASDYEEGRTVAENHSFDLFVGSSDDTAIQDAFGTWAVERWDEGQRFLVVHGSSATTTVSESRTRAKAFDDFQNIYLFPGYTDTDGVTYTGQEAAAYVAGLIGSKGYSRAITNSPIEGARSVGTVLGQSEVGLGLESGVLMIVADGGRIRMSAGINTLTATGGSGQPTAAFRKIRTIRTLMAIQTGIEDGAEPYLGEVTNNEDGRRSLAGAISAFLDELASAGVIAEDPAPTVEVTAGQSDQVFIGAGVTPLDSIEQVYVSLYVNT